MTHTEMKLRWEQKQRARWQRVYDKAFCEALDKDIPIADAADYALDKAMLVSSRIRNEA